MVTPAVALAVALASSPPAPPSLAAVSPEAPATAAPATCNALVWSLVWPGAGQLCDGKTGEGTALATVAAVEAGLATWGYLAAARDSGEGIEHPAVMLPLVGLQDLWVYGMADAYLERQRRSGMAKVPAESLADLATAPFDVDVLARPTVWAGTLGVLAAALAFGQLTDSSFDLRRGNPRPELFRRRWGSGGYGLGAAVGTAVFTQVAVAEEAIFRGVVQSGLAREHGDWTGWALGSLIFGATHLANLLLVPRGERLHYAAVDVPFITGVGSYLGLAYLWEEYSLRAPVAIHFWYDLLISLAFLAFDRDPGLFQIGLDLPW